MARPITSLILCALLMNSDAIVFGQVARLSESNWDQLVPAGKEVDAIYEDFALKSAAVKAIVAFPAVTRNSNMTVRGVGGCLIDLTATAFESDQLSCFYPGRRKFPFSSGTIEGNVVVMTSEGTAERPSCEVRYELSANEPVINVTSTWTNTTSRDWTLSLEDDLRADGGKEDMVKSPNGTHDLYYVHDIFWQQAYGFRAAGYSIRSNSNSREGILTWEPKDGQPIIMKPGKSFSFTRQIIVAKDLPGVLAVADRVFGDIKVSPVTISVTDANGKPVVGARLAISSAAGSSRGTTVTDSDGKIRTALPAGEFTLNGTTAGISLFSRDSVRVSVAAGSNDFALVSQTYKPGIADVVVTDDQGNAIPAKVEFIGSNETPTPDWAPETSEHFVKNLAYTENGKVQVPLQSGDYDVIVSHGAEHDAEFTRLHIEAGQTTDLKVSLKHSVQTPGWISADFHSHSSPSGDNTGSQRGRVLNLAAENIEFAPCTEHNRISTYDEHIAALGLKPFLATVSGMELTGQPLPLNHQNTFPLIRKPRTQDGGGPVTDDSPETQMERIALWDDRSEKLIQQNHPDIGWLFYDKNGDGKPDEGHSRSFTIMDVMEIHPIDRILTRERYDVRGDKPFGNNRILNWLQLLNQGFRIYGVVNTDAHYNYHGSGWLRNWIQSSTDQPAEIDPMEMVHASEQGRLIMSNGPYLEATFSEAGSNSTVVSGQDLVAKSGKVNIHVRVQCPNWLNVDTVFVLINGKPSDELTFTADANPDAFGKGSVKFDRTLNISLKEDAHLVVVTGHRSERLGDVMGPSGGDQHPAALTNPVFVDVDGNGFTPNKDTLGYPLPVKFIEAK